jgi:hypothetical protein
MLSPGEFVVNAKSTAKNKDLLHQINNGKTQYAAGGGIIGISSERDAMNKLLEERAARVRLMKIETAARQESNANRQSAFEDKLGGGQNIPGSAMSFSGIDTQNTAAEKQQKLKEQATRERAREISKRVARREKLGLPEYIPPSRRVDNTPVNAFNDQEAARLRGAQITRTNNVNTRNIAAQNIANAGNRNRVDFNGQRLQDNGFNNAAKQLAENSKPLVEALNNFPRELNIKRDGTIQVVLNGAEIINKMKGDLEKEVWAKIIETIQREVPKAVKKMPA